MSLTNLRIAWRNLGRNWRRTALAVLSVAIGQTALLGTTALMHGYGDNIRLAVTGPMVGHVQVHAPGWREERAMELVIPHTDQVLAAIRHDPSVESAAARLYAPVLVAPKQDAYSAMVLGIDVPAESAPYGMLAGYDRPLEPKHVLIGKRLATRIHVKPGDEIAVVGQAPNGAIANDLYTVQEIISCPVDLVNQSGIVMGLDDARQLLYLGDDAHEIVVRAHPEADSQALAARLAALPALKGLEVLPWQTLVPELETVIAMSDYMGYIVVLLVFVAAIAGIANTLIMSVFERQHELGMLLALGSRPVRLVRLVIIEAVLIGLIGVVLGTGLGTGLVAILHQTGVDFATWGGDSARDLSFRGLNLPLFIRPRLAMRDEVIGIVAILLTSLVASVWPAWITARLQPVEAMRA